MGPMQDGSGAGSKPKAGGEKRSPNKKKLSPKGAPLDADDWGSGAEGERGKERLEGRIWRGKPMGLLSSGESPESLSYF